jgi:Co/Zn/Cd efflux system component
LYATPTAAVPEPTTIRAEDPAVSASCCSNTPDRPDLPSHERERGSQRRILWIALAINAAMFLLEVVAGAHARSSSLQADALDFLADAANYAISLFVVAASLRRRAAAALVKGASMGVFGVWVLGLTVYQALTGVVPRAEVMGAVGVLALLANVGVLALLISFRRGDSNMRSVWICSRNDVLGNAAVLLAASGVFATRTGWPDVVVALCMAALALWGAAQVVSQAVGELRGTGRSSPDAAPSHETHARLA